MTPTFCITYRINSLLERVGFVDVEGDLVGVGVGVGAGQRGREKSEIFFDVFEDRVSTSE